jgi:type II secretory pathway component PulJ
LKTAANQQRGFTLLEGIFSMFITFLVLGALTYTLKQAGSVKSNTKNMDRISEVFHTLILIKADVRAALDILTPTSGSASVLELTRIDPDLDFLQRIDPGIDDDPFQTIEQEIVRYELENGVLKRRITNANLSFRSERLLSASNFVVETSSTPSILTVTLEVETSRVKKTHTMKVAVD